MQVGPSFRGRVCPQALVGSPAVVPYGHCAPLPAPRGPVDPGLAPPARVLRVFVSLRFASLKMAARKPTGRGRGRIQHASALPRCDSNPRPASVPCRSHAPSADAMIAS